MVDEHQIGWHPIDGERMEEKRTVSILGHPALWQENSDSRHFWSSCVRTGVTAQVAGLNAVREIKGGEKKKVVILLLKSSAPADINLSTLALLFLHQPDAVSTASTAASLPDSSIDKRYIFDSYSNRLVRNNAWWEHIALGSPSSRSSFLRQTLTCFGGVRGKGAISPMAPSPIKSLVFSWINIYCVAVLYFVYSSNGGMSSEGRKDGILRWIQWLICILCHR